MIECLAQVFCPLHCILKNYFQHTEFTDGIFLLMINGFLENVTSPWDFILNLTWCYGLFFCMFAMPIPFYYRYVCVCRYNLTVLSIANHEIKKSLENLKNQENLENLLKVQCEKEKKK